MGEILLPLSISAILKTSGINEIKEELDVFFMDNSSNPFIFTKAIVDEMNSVSGQNAFPVVLVFRVKGKIVGVAPLFFRQKLGVRSAQLLFGYDYSPDFFVDPKYRQICMQKTIEFIFNKLGSSFSTLDLPSGSMNLCSLASICKAQKIGVRIKNHDYMQHCVIPVNCTWDEFLKSKSHHFRHRFKNIEKKLRAAGEWKITSFSNGEDEPNVTKKIMGVEETCWKQNWRENNNISVDPYLQKDLAWSRLAARNFPGYKRSVWFLELNGQIIAYCLVVQYKGTAYISKTSYNNQFRHLYPGIYLINVVIRELFNSGCVRLIDFMTNLPFMQIWTDKRLLRVRFLLSKGFVPKLLVSFEQQPTLKLVLQKFFPLT